MQSLFSPTTEAAVRQYLLTRGEDIHLELYDDIEGMSLKEMLAIVREHGTPEDRHHVSQMFTKRMFGRDADPHAEDRRANIERSNRDLGITAAIQFAPGVPGALHFDTFDPTFHNDARAAYKAVQAWMQRSGPLMLTLAGITGTGKTHLADAAASVLLDRGEEIVFRREQDLTADVRARISTQTSDVALSEYGQVPWLVIDELGGENRTDFIDATMDQLIDARWQGARAGTRWTLITTNLVAADLPTRVASRLGDNTVGAVLEVRSPDYRRARQ
jgi:DNA replication protein DnaC